MSELSVVCVGAAVQDVFLFGNVLKPKREDGKWVEEFPLGAKLDLDGITYSTGGGATNGAVTFSKQGYKAKIMAKVAHDAAGDAVKTDMKKHNINTSMIAYSNKYATGYSVLLVAPNGERTILTYRGASSHYRKENFDLSKVHGDWLFITSLAGNMELLDALVKHAESRHMKIALIPGKGELKESEWLKSLLPKCHIASANVEEWQMLIDGQSKEVLAKNAAKILPVAVVTDGPKGVAACDGKKLVVAGMYEDVPVVDRTGAGDAFASGFVSWYGLGSKLEDAITFASANSTSVVSMMGAKKGILSRRAKIHRMDMHIENIEG